MRPGLLRREHAGDDDMADDQHRDIGRRIVGALMAEILARRPDKRRRPSDRRETSVPSPQCGQRPKKPRRTATPSRAGRSGHLAIDPCRHRSGSPSSLRRPLPASRLAVSRKRRGYVCARLLSTLPSESISKRSAPAKGAASTSFTSTLSPSRKVSPVRVPTSARARFVEAEIIGAERRRGNEAVGAGFREAHEQPDPGDAADARVETSRRSARPYAPRSGGRPSRARPPSRGVRRRKCAGRCRRVPWPASPAGRPARASSARIRARWTMRSA